MTTLDEIAGHFGQYGGRFVPEALIGALEELDAARIKAQTDPTFIEELAELHRTYTGRPSILTEAKRFAEHAGGARILLKREDLNHTGSHKINNVLGQALLTKRMGKKRIIAETGAGQHGVASATAAALMGLECVVYMGEEDTKRQALNVARMKLLGAEVIPVTSGSRTLKDAINEAMRDWVTNVETTHYMLGTVAGPHPFPSMVRDFHKIIGEESREQVLALTGKLPTAVLACVGGGSNAIGIFHRFISDPEVRLIGLEAAGDGVETGRHAATITGGSPGVLHGNRTARLLMRRRCMHSRFFVRLKESFLPSKLLMLSLAHFRLVTSSVLMQYCSLIYRAVAIKMFRLRRSILESHCKCLHRLMISL